MSDPPSGVSVGVRPSWEAEAAHTGSNGPSLRNRLRKTIKRVYRTLSGKCIITEDEGLTDGPLRGRRWRREYAQDGGCHFLRNGLGGSG